MTSFLLKIIAISCMFCDHYGDAIIGHFSILNYIGRIAFPIFAFQIAQGYIHTKNIKKYMFRLIAFAIISQIPFYLFFKVLNVEIAFNVIFTLFIGLVGIFAYDRIKNKFLSINIIILLSAIAELINVDYGAYGVIVVFIFYLFSKLKIDKDNNDNKYTNSKYIYLRITTALSFIIVTIIKYYFDYLYDMVHGKIFLISALCTFISLLPICLYNGKQGPKAKYIFYIFYPLHLLVLYLVHIYLY